MKEFLLQTQMKSPLGDIFLVISEKGLKKISFRKEPGIRLGRSALSDKVVAQLRSYFAGKKVQFTVPLDVEGTPFQKRVWSELQKIPFGETRSYRDIALGIKNPRAVRAVGSANGRNPVCIVVPCHRVIAADGTLGGYTGGLEKKRKLLKIETNREFREK